MKDIKKSVDDFLINHGKSHHVSNNSSGYRAKNFFHQIEKMYYENYRRRKN
jgi:hypothetical protein